MRYGRVLQEPAEARARAVGLTASRAATDDKPAVEGVRLHDLRHTFAVLQLSAGVHFMQVSQWIGHATYSLSLDVYGGYIPQAMTACRTPCRSPPPRLRLPISLATWCHCDDRLVI